MTDSTNTASGDATDDDTVDMSALITTIESAIDEHRKSQQQLQKLTQQLETSLQEHNKSEQKLRQLLTHTECLIDDFEMELSIDSGKSQTTQQSSNFETQVQAASQKDSPAKTPEIDEAATADSSAESMLEVLETVCADLNRLPEASDIRQETDYTSQDYAEEFGSYMNACRESTIDLERYVLKDIETVSEKLETIPPLWKYQNKGRFSKSLINSLFGSWGGVKNELYRKGSLSWFSTRTESYREELIYQLQELETSHGHLQRPELSTRRCG